MATMKGKQLNYCWKLITYLPLPSVKFFTIFVGHPHYCHNDQYPEKGLGICAIKRMAQLMVLDVLACDGNWMLPSTPARREDWQ